jgi:hypothetical protein
MIPVAAQETVTYMYVSWESLNPINVLPHCVFLLTPVLFYKLTDLITYMYSGFHMNIPHPIFTPECFSRWHILFCTETGMHQKLTNVSALCSADIELCTFLTLSLDTEEWLASHPWQACDISWIGGWLEPCIWSWHYQHKKKHLALARNEPWFLDHPVDTQVTISTELYHKDSEKHTAIIRTDIPNDIRKKEVWCKKVYVMWYNEIDTGYRMKL